MKYANTQVRTYACYWRSGGVRSSAMKTGTMMFTGPSTCANGGPTSWPPSFLGLPGGRGWISRGSNACSLGERGIQCVERFDDPLNRGRLEVILILFFVRAFVERYPGAGVDLSREDRVEGIGSDTPRRFSQGA